MKYLLVPLFFIALSSISFHSYSQILSQFYASTGNDGSSIIKINPTTGHSSFFANSGAFGPVTEVQIDPTGTILYGTTGGGTNSLIAIDLVTGVETLVGELAPDGAINGLEFVNGLLIGTFWSPGDEADLIVIDPETTDIIYGFRLEDLFAPVTGLAYNVTTGIIYGITQFDGDGSAFLISIDLDTEEVEDAVVLPPGALYRGLAFGPNGSLYTGIFDFDRDQSYIATIDIITGEITTVRSTEWLTSGLSFYIPEYIYGSTGNAGESLIAIDAISGATEMIGTNGDFGPVTEIQHDPTGRFLYGTTGGGNSSLIKIDLATADETLVAEHMDGNINGLEFYNYTLYGTIFNPALSNPSNLVIVDPQTANLTTVGSTGLGPISGLAYNYATRTMYGITVDDFDSPTSELVTIDLNTGAATTLGPVSGFPYLRGLTYGPYGNMYTTDIDNGSLVLIDPETVSGTEIGDIDVPVSGLSYYNAPPVPLSNWAVFLGIALIGVFMVIRYRIKV